MKNEVYRSNIGYELERYFDTEDTYNASDFFNSVSQLTEEYFSSREKGEDVSILADTVGLYVKDVENSEMTEPQFAASVNEVMEGDDW